MSVLFFKNLLLIIFTIIVYIYFFTLAENKLPQSSLPQSIPKMNRGLGNLALCPCLGTGHFHWEVWYPYSDPLGGDFSSAFNTPLILSRSLLVNLKDLTTKNEVSISAICRNYQYCRQLAVKSTFVSPGKSSSTHGGSKKMKGSPNNQFTDAASSGQ